MIAKFLKWLGLIIALIGLFLGLLDLIGFFSHPDRENMVQTIRSKGRVPSSNPAFSDFIKKYEDPEGYASLKAVLGEKILRIVGERLDSFKRILLGIKVGIEFWRWNTEIIIIHAPKETTSTLVEDCSLAACHIMLAAETLGLATCSLGFATALLNQFSSVSELVKIPKGNIVGYTLSIGYPNVKYHRIPARKPVRVKWL